MLLDWLADRRDDPAARAAAVLIDNGLTATIRSGTRTADLGGTVGTAEFAAAVAAEIGR
jgi:3-isopropylmalate dehydrogenase